MTGRDDEGKQRLHFNYEEYAWREDLDDRVVIYKFGGQRIMILQGRTRKNFLALVRGESSVVCFDKLLSLVDCGVLKQSL